MATRTATARTFTANARIRKVAAVKAKCEANQAAVDLLMERRESAGNSNYSFTLKRAIESLAKHAEPITSYQQALALPFVGPHTAKLICPTSCTPKKKKAKTKAAEELPADGTQKQHGKKRKDPPSSSQKSAVDDMTSVVSSIRMESSSSSAIISTKTAASQNLNARVFKQTVLAPVAGAGSEQAASLMLRTIESEKPSAKELAYQKAVEHGETWKRTFQGKQLQWRAVLLVDQREVKSQHMVAKCQMSGIPCQERTLPIGDMAWIAQGFYKESQVEIELMLGTMVERKTVEDLKASLFGTRYNEQQLRLKHSGIPQVLFLIEGDLTKELYHCTSETMHTTVWAIRLHKQFSIVQTAHMDETVRALKRMHRRILQRAFPSAFYQQGLPTFTEPDARGLNDRRDSFGDTTTTTTTSATTTNNNSNNQAGDDSGGGRRRRHVRRRVQSLMEMTFDTDPVPLQGMSRLITYQELKTKVERDREAGTRTIGSIHAAMVKQVPSLSQTKVQALCNAFPTPSALLMAYDAAAPNEEAAKNLVTELPTGDAKGTAVANRKMGARSSAELYVAYGLGSCTGVVSRSPDDATASVTNSSSAESTTASTCKGPTTYHEHLARMQQTQTRAVRAAASGESDGDTTGPSAKIPVTTATVLPSAATQTAPSSLRPTIAKTTSLDEEDFWDSLHQESFAQGQGGIPNNRSDFSSSQAATCDRQEEEPPARVPAAVKTAAGTQRSQASVPLKWPKSSELKIISSTQAKKTVAATNVKCAAECVDLLSSDDESLPVKTSMPTKAAANARSNPVMSAQGYYGSSSSDDDDDGKRNRLLADSSASTDKFRSQSLDDATSSDDSDDLQLYHGLTASRRQNAAVGTAKRKVNSRPKTAVGTIQEVIDID